MPKPSIPGMSSPKLVEQFKPLVTHVVPIDFAPYTTVMSAHEGPHWAPNHPGIRCSLKPLGGQRVRGRSVACEALCAIRGHTNKMHLKDFNAKGVTASRTHPWIPFFGGLLLNWRVCLCLNLGGPLRGVAGPPVTLVADFISALGASRFMLRSYRQVGEHLWEGCLLNLFKDKKREIQRISSALSAEL